MWERGRFHGRDSHSHTTHGTGSGLAHGRGTKVPLRVGALFVCTNPPQACPLLHPPFSSLRSLSPRVTQVRQYTFPHFFFFSPHLFSPLFLLFFFLFFFCRLTPFPQTNCVTKSPMLYWMRAWPKIPMLKLHVVSEAYIYIHIRCSFLLHRNCFQDGIGDGIRRNHHQGQH